jgi:hypothetical protein
MPKSEMRKMRMSIIQEGNLSLCFFLQSPRLIYTLSFSILCESLKAVARSISRFRVDL